MLAGVLFFLNYALITLPFTGALLFALLRWRGIEKTRNLMLSFGILPFPLLLITYVLSALIVNGPHGRFHFLRYVELCVQAYPFHVAICGVALIMMRRRTPVKYFIAALIITYLCASLWQVINPYG